MLSRPKSSPPIVLASLLAAAVGLAGCSNSLDNTVVNPPGTLPEGPPQPNVKPTKQAAKVEPI